MAANLVTKGHASQYIFWIKYIFCYYSYNFLNFAALQLDIIISSYLFIANYTKLGEKCTFLGTNIWKYIITVVDFPGYGDVMVTKLPTESTGISELNHIGMYDISMPAKINFNSLFLGIDFQTPSFGSILHCIKILIQWSCFAGISTKIHIIVVIHPLKRKCRRFDEIFIIGCTESCQNDNFQCSQWWKFHQNDNISVSVSSSQCHPMGLKFQSSCNHPYVSVTH